MSEELESTQREREGVLKEMEAKLALVPEGAAYEPLRESVRKEFQPVLDRYDESIERMIGDEASDWVQQSEEFGSVTAALQQARQAFSERFPSINSRYQLSVMSIPRGGEPAEFVYVARASEAGTIAKGELFSDHPSGRPPRVQRTVHTRTRRSSEKITTEKDYQIPILAILVSFGGRAHVQDVLPEVERRMRAQLKPDDYEPVPSGEIRWQNAARWSRNTMARKTKPPLLNPSSPHGWWEITEAGREELRKARWEGPNGQV